MASRAVKVEGAAKRRRRHGHKASGPVRAAANRNSAPAPVAGGTRAAGAAPRTAAAPAVAPPTPVALTEEERIESAKYVQAQPRPRAFEDERFLFPESYGRNRLRLLVKDPEWLFAYWDVAQSTLTSLRRDVGVRAVAVSPLTLRVVDAATGHFSVIFLAEGTRSWYVKTDGRTRPYRAELGLTLPSGEFRRLAQSNTLTAPGSAPSSEPATRKAAYSRTGVRGLAAPTPAAEAAIRSAAANRSQVLPPQPGLYVPAPAGQRGRSAKGGASDAFGPRRPR
ncbi:MAG: DUF4912 domain-containing protein [Vicinamibacteria bacterium]|nr:DUF4912 domain-containing protein [Vicinamibacteria bacterium]